MQRRSWLMRAGQAVAATALAPVTAGLAGCRRSTEVTADWAGPDMALGHAWRQMVLRGEWPVPAVERRTRVVIAGGGMAGLAAARALRLAGESDFMLFELDAEAGGNSRGHVLGGEACPLGAHYLPVPGDDAPEVQDWLEELGVRQRVAGRWQYDERYLCHSLQERLFLHGAWQEGTLPVEGVPASTLAQYRRFSELVAQLAKEAPFRMPAWRGWGQGEPLHPVLAELDAQSFATWLIRQGLDDRYLHWYLNYCCRDDYGAGVTEVSAWAGLHYFASRGGFHAPEADESASEGVLTWPEGNGWLAQQLIAPLHRQGQLQAGCAVLRISEERHGVALDVWRHASQRVERWLAQRCVVALPAFVAQRVVQPALAVLQKLGSALRQAPWLVANLHVQAPLAEYGDVPLAWDNVIFDDPNPGALGYVHAGHQRLDARVVRGTVLTYYQALGDKAGARAELAESSLVRWRDASMQSVRRVHPDLDELLTEVSVTRHGHAMAVPEPGRLQLVHAMANPQGAGGGRMPAWPVVQTGRLAFAHADWAAYSVLEEAFTRGHHAGLWAARQD